MNVVLFYRTDFIFHAIQRTTGEIVDFDTFISQGNEDQIFSALIRNLRTCTPERITVRLSCIAAGEINYFSLLVS